MKQPIPNVSEADVERIVNRDFGEAGAIDVLSALGRFSISPRVQLAILKLANGDFDKLQEAGNVALRDYRDVLFSAEYPTCMDVDISNALNQAVVESDWRQYQEWLQRS